MFRVSFGGFFVSVLSTLSDKDRPVIGCDLIIIFIFLGCCVDLEGGKIRKCIQDEYTKLFFFFGFRFHFVSIV